MLPGQWDRESRSQHPNCHNRDSEVLKTLLDEGQGGEGAHRMQPGVMGNSRKFSTALLFLFSVLMNIHRFYIASTHTHGHRHAHTRFLLTDILSILFYVGKPLKG